MIISYQSNDTVSIKTRNETILAGNGLVIGTYRIDMAGEYDISGIQCVASYLSKALVCFLRAEDLTITFLGEVDTDITKLDDASNTDVLIIDTRSDATIEELKSILKVVEPSYLLLTGAGATQELIAGLGLPAFDGTQLKLTRAALPLEGTFILAR